MENKNDFSESESTDSYSKDLDKNDGCGQESEEESLYEEDESASDESGSDGSANDQSVGDGISGDESGEDNNSDDDDDDNDKYDAAQGEELIKIKSLNADDIRAMEFSSVDEAYEFYFKYGNCKGFAVRKSDIRTKKEDGVVVMRQFVCNKQGSRDKRHLSRADRKRDHRRLTHTQCPARLRIHFRPNRERYVVTIFEEGHNHELTPSSYVHLHPVYRKISEADKAQIDGLQSHGIRTCHIMGYMVAQKGGYVGVGFTKKDLYNYFDKKMRAVIKEGDISVALNYLKVKSSTDPMMYCEYSATDDGRLKCLFWADGTSRSDYFCFGDVLAFDTTYNKNKYNYPLVILSGCNHHSQTVIYGAALVMDETIDSYMWVLSSFLDCMEKKYPRAVVTDGDGAMREAIKKVFRGTRHRLCAWHLHKNAVDNVKNSAFLDGFKTAMYSNFTVDEFEQFWVDLVKRNGLENNSWVLKTIKGKEKELLISSRTNPIANTEGKKAEVGQKRKRVVREKGKKPTRSSARLKTMIKPNKSSTADTICLTESDHDEEQPVDQLHDEVADQVGTVDGVEHGMGNVNNPFNGMTAGPCSSLLQHVISWSQISGGFRG